MASEMTPERWQAVERVYHAAREVNPARRDAFLKSECGQDEPLRREVESLLRYDTAADRYLERSALDESAVSLQQGRSPLPAGRRIGGYEIVSLLGAGGMGDVYQARELRLGRDVALKVLEHPAFADSAWRLRFEEEARAASGLNHPNIVTIYGVGEDGDLAFIAMELVRGRTLREALAAGTLGSRAALDLAAQLADALTAAHTAGIVHRDLKPENLMVTADGLLKVLDFGIAKRQAGADPPPQPVHPATGMLTQRGAILGTVGYMSPEQADGRQVDYRSDQFSFGAIVYEMLTGRRAFERSTQADTLEAIRSAQAPMDELGVGVPIQFRTVVQRCLAKRPEERYAQTAEIARDLRQLREETRRPVSPGGVTRRRALWMSGAAVVSVAGAVAWRVWPWGTPVRSLAVLPFDNPDDTPGLEYLCDGITDSLIRRLGYVPELDVRPSSASLNFKQHQIDAATAGRQLGVDAVLAGAIRRRADVLEVSVGLADVASGSTTWSATYQRRPADLPQLQQDLARAIVSEGVRRSLTSRDRRRFDRQPTQDDVALDLFLRGIHAHRQGGEQNYLSARRLLQQAVDRDPTFAIALVSLASTYTVMTIDGFERPSASWPESNRLIRRALDIDPDLPEAHAEQASSWFFFDHDWDAAEREWKQSIHGEPSPARPDLLNAAALKLWALRRVDDAISLIREARVLDPLTPRLAAQEGHLLRHAGRVEEAIRVYSEVLDRAPDQADAGLGLAEAYRIQGQFDRAIALRRRAHGAAAAGLPAPMADVLAHARGERGYREIERVTAMAEAEGLEAARAQGAYVSPLDLARAYAQLGRADEAFQHLDAAFEERSPGLVFLHVDRAWTSVRDDARFDAALRALRMP